jgi:phosphoenolpyruvate carboxykinase (GTP)
MQKNEHIQSWVNEVADLCQPDSVVWCDGSQEEYDRLIAEAVASGVLIKLNQQKLPGCYLHRSHPSDVARTEHLTFVCTSDKEDAGPNNNWMAPADARTKVSPLFKGAMKGRKMYVVPFLMGPKGSRFSKVGVEITDSIYVAINMRIMTRMGKVALDHLGQGGDFTRCLHSLGDLSPDRRYIMHFPEQNEIWSIGSGYGGNALLGKKCLALRLASWLGKKEGWLAEHMLILGVQAPGKPMHYITGAFPSACGKTNLAMLVPPRSMPGWKVETVGDDISWLHPGEDGRLYAINPESGFFGVVPGTSSKTNPNAMATIQKNTIYTNVALKPDGTVWWEGHDEPPVEGMLDWQGRPWKPGTSDKAAHPNSRFTAPASQCPSISPKWEDPEGVPISAILFGARRQRRVPLVYEAESWDHGTFLGATLTSETTAAATGQVGVLRRDSMAMQPFCGYNFGDYFAHWHEVGKKLQNPPRIFRVNWFRTDAQGKFLWPGFGDNLRVIQWVIDRCEGHGEAVKTAIGYIPAHGAINLRGVDVAGTAMDQLLKVDPAEWAEAVSLQFEYFERYGERTPASIWREHSGLVHRISEAVSQNIPPHPHD